MAPDGNSGSRNNNSRGRKRTEAPWEALRKGPWTAEEDAILNEYVRMHGEGNWNAVQRNTGLMRCGKSCRLRWANHLRPDLKKGAFSAEEEAMIVDLHAKFGNKWARMAAQLPGRTDNEIKNYWNTRLKRRQRACLQHEIQNHQTSAPSNPPSSSLLSLISSDRQARNPGHTANISLYDIFDSSTTMTTPNPFLNSSCTYNPNKLFHHNSGAISSWALSSKRQSGAGFNNHRWLSAHNSSNFDSGSTSVLGVSYEQNPLVSIRSFVPPTGPTSSSNGSSGHVCTKPSDANEHTNSGFSRVNSGLLGDSFGESETRKEKIKENSSEADGSQQNYLWDYKLMDDAARSPHHQSFLTYCEENFIEQKHSHESSPAHSSIGAKVTAALNKETNLVDDDFLSLLDNIPLTVPMPDWYDEDGAMLNAQSSGSIDGETVKQNHPYLLNSSTAMTSQAFVGYAGSGY